MWLDRYRALLCDLDGCLVTGGKPLPGARELVDYAGDRLLIVSNNSTDTPHTLAAKLARSGLNITPDRIVLAGAIAVEYVAAAAPRAPIAIYGSAAIAAYAASLGLRVGHGEPRFVLLARDLRFSYARIHRIVRQIERGAEFIVSNLDISHPGPGRRRVFETGVLVAAIEACLPGVDYLAVGTPSPLLYQAAMRRVTATKDQLLAIGDNPATDEEGARRAEIPSVLVGTTQGAHFENLTALMRGRHTHLAEP